MKLVAFDGEVFEKVSDRITYEMSLLKETTEDEIVSNIFTESDMMDLYKQKSLTDLFYAAVTVLDKFEESNGKLENLYKISGKRATDLYIAFHLVEKYALKTILNSCDFLTNDEAEAVLTLTVKSNPKLSLVKLDKLIKKFTNIIYKNKENISLD